MAIGGQIPFRRVERAVKPQVQLIESRCPLCGGFIAASTDPRLVELAEGIHTCPESLMFEQQPEQR
jgi:hypothetical protein